jgi:hypothetical protein
MKADNIYASYTNNISKNIVLYYDANSNNAAIHDTNVYIHKDTRTVQEIKESYYKPYEHISGYMPKSRNVSSSKFSFVVYMILAFMLVLFMLFI